MPDIQANAPIPTMRKESLGTDADQTIRHPEDAGMKVVRIAPTLTPEQVSELSAVRWFSIAVAGAPRTPIAGHHWREGGIYPALVDLGLIEGKRFHRAWGDRDALVPHLTILGELVLHHLASRAMVAQGVMASCELPECADVEG